MRFPHLQGTAESVTCAVSAGPGPVEVEEGEAAARPPGTEPVEAPPGPGPVEEATAAAHEHHLALVRALADSGGRPAETELARLLHLPAGGKRRQLQRRLGAALGSLPAEELAELMGQMAAGIRGAAG